MYKIIFIVLFLISLSTSFAGNEVGNGGVGFWCAETKKYLLLDFYEQELLNPENKIIISSEENFGKIINDRLKLLEKLDERNYRLYSLKAKAIIEKINFLEDIKLNETHDSFEVAQPKGCLLKQFALQRVKIANNETEFFFDKEIWNKLDPVSKAGLVLHEVIYEQFAFLGEKNSIKVRKLNSLIMSQKFEKLNSVSYRKFITDLRLPLY